MNGILCGFPLELFSFTLLSLQLLRILVTSDILSFSPYSTIEEQNRRQGRIMIHRHQSAYILKCIHLLTVEGFLILAICARDLKANAARDEVRYVQRHMPSQERRIVLHNSEMIFLRYIWTNLCKINSFLDLFARRFLLRLQYVHKYCTNKVRLL